MKERRGYRGGEYTGMYTALKTLKDNALGRRACGVEVAEDAGHE